MTSKYLLQKNLEDSPAYSPLCGYVGFFYLGDYKMADHTREWEEQHPDGTEAVSLGDDRIVNLKVDLGERLEDLLYGFNKDDGTGDEATPGIKVLNFKEQESIELPSADQINVAAKEGADGDDKAQLWAEDEDGNERQLTKTSGSALRLNVKAGDYAADSVDEDDIRLANNSYLTGRNQAGNGDINVIKVNTSNEIELGAVTKLPNTSKLATSGAPTANAQIANKKYVDDQIAAIQDPSYSGGESHTFDGGLIIKMGSGSYADGTTITFETPFPNAIISAHFTGVNTGSGCFNLNSNPTKANIVVRQDVGGSVTIHWIAIGY